MTLVFNKPVDFDSIFELIEKIKLSRETDIAVTITSCGGNPKAILPFKDFIEQNNINLNTIASGTVASSAVALFMLGNKRQMLNNSYLLIHEPVVFFKDDSVDIYDLEENLKRIKVTREDFFSDLLSKTKVTNRILKNKIYKKDWYIKKEEAISLNIATK